MRKLFCDFETYYDHDCTLRKMTPLEYVWHPRFSITGAALAFDDGPSMWVDGDMLPALFARIDWTQTIMVSHNIAFDGLVLSERLGIIPRLYVDTLGLSRAILGVQLRRHSLASVAKHLGLPAKGTAIANAMGYDLAALRANPTFFAEYRDYAEHDNDLCRMIFKYLAPQLPQAEFLVMDRLIRMITQPQFRLNLQVMEEHRQSLLAKKASLLARVDHMISDKKQLGSGNQFAQLLLDRGVAPPMKTSPATGQPTFAFSKQDAEFLNLLEHEDEEVQVLVAARLGVKSTSEESRTERLISLASLAPLRTTAAIPLPLKYSAAHTHRFGGDWKLNFQNVGRDSRLREAIEAQDGHVVVTADASQIECRINAVLAQERQMIDGFARGEDLYAEFASDVTGMAITKKTHPVERFTGKTAILGLGYGMGPPRFQLAARVQSKGAVRIDLDTAQTWVSSYRAKYRAIVALWKAAERMLRAMVDRSADVAFGPCTVSFERITLPNGMFLQYPDLRHDPQIGWSCDDGGGRKYLFGGKLVENVVQALARIAVVEAAMRVERRTGYPLVLQVHDSLLFHPREQDGEAVLAATIEEMSRTPDWLPEAPFAAEGGLGRSIFAAEQDAQKR